MPDWTEGAIAALLQEPDFDRAARAAAATIVGHLRGHWILNRLISDRGRFLLNMIVLDLHHANGEIGFSLTEVRSLVSTMDVCSPGRVTAFLALLRLMGLLRLMPSKDRRLRRLVPTEQLLQMHRERWRGVFEALALIRPEGAVAAKAMADPAFLGRFAHALVDAYRAGLRFSDVVPQIRRISERDAGMMILLSVFLAEAAGQAVPIATLAKAFTVSRAHVLTVLREAEPVGLVQLSGPRGGYRVGPTMLGTMRRFFAVVFLLHLHGIATARANKSTVTAPPSATPHPAGSSRH